MLRSTLSGTSRSDRRLSVALLLPVLILPTALLLGGCANERTEIIVVVEPLRRPR